jgi:hypothetical protein
MYLARGIHAGYMRDTYEIHVSLSAQGRGYIDDTCGIHERYIIRYMYLNQGGHIKIRSRYMHDTCTIHGIRILITTPPKFDNKPPVTRGTSSLESNINKRPGGRQGERIMNCWHDLFNCELVPSPKLLLTAVSHQRACGRLPCCAD